MWRALLAGALEAAGSILINQPVHGRIRPARLYDSHSRYKKHLQTNIQTPAGTAGSTGVSLSLVAAARGYRCFIAMPDDAAIEKAEMLKASNACVSVLEPCDSF